MKNMAIILMTGAQFLGVTDGPTQYPYTAFPVVPTFLVISFTQKSIQGHQVVTLQTRY
jgi:hypothetical protein